MLKDLDTYKIPIKIGNEDLYLLYNLNAKLCMEYMTGEKYEDILSKDNWSTDEILIFLKAMLIDNYYEENKDYISKRKFELCRPALSELGRLINEIDIENIILNIISCIAESMPKAPIDETGNFQKAVQKK